VGFIPTPKHQKAAAAPGKAAPVTTTAGPQTTQDKLLTDWVCTPCGVLVIDKQDVATKCPGCKAPRDKPVVAPNPKDSVLLQMKAPTCDIVARCSQGNTVPADGTLPIPKEAQDAQVKYLKLQDETATLERLEHLPGVKQSIADCKAEMAKLKPKLQKAGQGLIDQAQAIQAINDIKEKQVLKENTLKEQQSKAQEQKQLSIQNLQDTLREIDEQAEAKNKLFREAATKAQELHEATIVETKRQLALVEQQTEELLHKIQPHAGTQTAQQKAPEAAPNATLIPVAPGDIIHSNSVNPAELATGMASSPGLLKLGLTPEQLQVIADLSVESILCQLKAKSLAVPAPPQAAVQQVDLQTVNMQAEAETKRKAEEVDDGMTEESSYDEEPKDVKASDDRDNSKPPAGKMNVNREEKKERKAKSGKGAPKGTASVQK